MSTRNSQQSRCIGVKRILLAFSALALIAFAIGISPQPALAQAGVDNPTATGVFQMEGDAQRTGTICWLPIASGGPAIATPGSTAGGNPNKLDSNGCPTVNPAGNAATWSLIQYGSNTDDWSSFVFSLTTGAFTSKAHSLFDPAFVTDAVGSTTDNTFLGTASKDTDDISAWTWNPHGTQDKDDIAHAFAGAYHLANGDTAIYAGMDRFANSGDSTAGFWFVQDSTFALCVGQNLAATGNGGTVANASCTASGTFVGHHSDGDLLLVSDFSQGGAVSTINAFVWNGGGSNCTGSLCLDASRSPAPCDPLFAITATASTADNICGLVNNAFVQTVVTKGGKSTTVLNPTTVATGGWGFSNKVGGTAYRTGEFLEISVDLNKLFPNSSLPCFSTFFSETRSSTSASASLSDLTTPVSFPLCSLSADKTCDTASIVNGNQIQYNFSGHVTNTGSSTIYNPVVYDTYPVTPVGTPVLSQPTGPINSGSNATFSGHFVSSSILSSTDKNRISAAASSVSGGTLNVVCGTNPPTTDANECADWGSPCTVSPSPGLTLAKLCSTCLVSGTDLHVSVNEAFKVCNTGNVNITGITIKDCQGGKYSGASGSQVCSGTEVTIASGVSVGAQVGNTPTCSQVYTNTYVPTTTGVCDNTNNNCSLHDEAIASGTAALGGGAVYANGGVPKGADCPVCPIYTTCSTPTL